MADKDEVHQLVRSEAGFESFIEEVNDQASFYGVFVAVEKLGRETEPGLEQNTIGEIDYMMLGWLRLLWEAHHQHSIKVSEEELEKPNEFGLKDLLFTAG